MAIQLGTTVRNARLDAIEVTIGTTPILRIRSGSPPANCATADSGTVLAECTLPSDWMGAAAAGAKAMAGTWQDLSANANGTAAHFRIYDSGGSVVHMQGTVAMSPASGDMMLDNTSLSAGQEFHVTQFTLTDGNA